MNLFRHATLAAPLAVLIAACGSTTSNPDAGSGLKDVAINFKFTVDGQPFDCAMTYTGVGANADAGGQYYRGTYARFYVHDVRLVDSSGTAVAVALTADGVWQLPDAGVVEIDGENGGTCSGANGNLEVVGTVPAGTYDGLEFKVGLPNDINHLMADLQPSPLNQSAMFWSWTGGYRFLRIEGAGENKKALAGGLLHLGSTGCVANDASDLSKGATCTYPNTIDVAFSSFDPDTNKVVLDIGNLFRDTDIMTNAGLATGCMSALHDPECPAIFKKLGLPYGDDFQEDGGFTVVTPTTGQTIFTME